MKITNLMGLPEPLVDALVNDDYSKGDADFSVTELLSPPRISALRLLYEQDIIEDASDRIWLLFGKLAHLVLERAGKKNALRNLAEWRGSIEIAGKTISGQIDNLFLSEGVLTDYKVTNAYVVKGGAMRDEWPWQLALYRLIAMAHGFKVTRLEICALIRNWSATEARRSSDYPQAAVMMIPVPLIPDAEVIRFFAERIALHEQARRGDLPLCTPAERWQRPTEWAVMKDGRKSALRVLDTEAEAMAWREAHSKGPTQIVERPGENVRCNNPKYCKVSPWCDWWQANKPVTDHTVDTSAHFAETICPVPTMPVLTKE